MVVFPHSAPSKHAFYLTISVQCFLLILLFLASTTMTSKKMYFWNHQVKQSLFIPIISLMVLLRTVPIPKLKEGGSSITDIGLLFVLIPLFFPSPHSFQASHFSLRNLNSMNILIFFSQIGRIKLRTFCMASDAKRWMILQKTLPTKRLLTSFFTFLTALRLNQNLLQQHLNNIMTSLLNRLILIVLCAN